MPKHEDEKTPAEMTNPATHAHMADDDKPPTTPNAFGDRAAPVKTPAKADAAPAEPTETPSPKARASKADEPPADPVAPRRTIEDLLADPTFDPDGKVRSRLAAISSRDGLGQFPPADLVDEHGQPVG